MEFQCVDTRLVAVVEAADEKRSTKSLKALRKKSQMVYRLFWQMVYSRLGEPLLSVCKQYVNYINACTHLAIAS